MTFNKGRWVVTSDKFLSIQEVGTLCSYLTNQRDLAIARGTNSQAIRDYYAIRTLLESGLRVFEFVALANGDFNGLKLTVRRGKGGKPRTVLLTRATAHLLKEWHNVKSQLGHSLTPMAPLFPSRYGTAYTTRGIQKRVKLIFAVLGLAPNLSAHSLRHTYCSLLLASGKVGLGTVRDNMGHHSISVTNLYSHAVGDLSAVELYPAPSSEKTELCELHGATATRKSNNSVDAFLRKANFKTGVRR